jgi:hypothetical protein
MSWLSGLSATDRPSSAASARVAACIGQVAEGEAQEIELVARGREQEIALIARKVGGAVQFGSVRPLDAADVVAGGEAARVELPRGVQQIAELDALIAAHAGDRRGPGEIAVDEIVDHAFAKPRLVIENIVREAHALRDPARVANVGAGAAGPAPSGRRAMIVELQRHADHVAALTGERRRDNGAVDAAGHGDDDTPILRQVGAKRLKIAEHRANILSLDSCGFGSFIRF